MTLTPADAAFEARLRADLPEALFRPAEPRYFEDPRGRLTGVPGLVLAPQTTDQVAAIVRACAAARVGIVPYGGGTGLVLGQVMDAGPAPVILSLERMKAIRAVHAEENVIVAEAGATLAEVQAAAEGVDRLFPLSLASEGSCQIGGNLATNAGGVNVLRYGNTRELCLGLEAVLPDGSVWNGLHRLRKDNTGYDLRGLLIGAEGSLGVITAASLRLFARNAHQGAALFVVPGPDAALELLALAGARLGQAISAFELIHGQGLKFLSETLPDLRLPFEDPPEWCVLIDLGMGAGGDPDAALADLFEAALEAGLTEDGIIAKSATQRAEIWAMREHIPEANRRIGAIASHDISVPLGEITRFIATAGAALAEMGDFRINCFGHLGDGNLHYNVFPAPGKTRADYAGQGAAVTRLVHDIVRDHDGSFSAEHGVGRAKTGDVERYGDPAKLAAMRAIKAALDPGGIMNPGVMLAG